MELLNHIEKQELKQKPKTACHPERSECGIIYLRKKQMTK